MFANILYIGSLDEKSNSYRRYKTFEHLVNKISGINVDSYIYQSITRIVDHHFNFGVGTIRLNLALRKYDYSLVDLILVDNRPFLFKSTLMFIKKKYPTIKIANILTDDPNGKYKSGWRLLKKTTHLYDVHFVQRKQNIQELKTWGAKRVETCFRSFDPNFHRKKNNIKKSTQFDVGFIGSYEEQREESIFYLVNNGIKVQIIGDGWKNGKYFETLKPYYLGPSVYGELYVDSINSMPIALHFLRVGNRDEQDSRTFEIPACGTPMVAEYSEVHKELFGEGEEVLLFRSNEELLEKVNYLIKNPIQAEKQAIAAMQRCVRSGYDHQTTLIEVLKKIKI
jgi:spore maturation protein CgeB